MALCDREREGKSMVSTPDPSSLLAKIKQRPVTWIDVVRTLGDLESRSTTDEHGRAWARVVAERTGNSLNQLRKMQRTVRTVEQLAKRNSFDLEKLLQSVPFSQVEILARIAKADEQAALDLIRACLTANRLPTYRELLDRFYEIRDAAPQVSSIAAGQRAARKFEGLCFDLLSQTKATILPGFSGEPVKVLRWSGGLRFASPDLIIARRDESNALLVDAVDCYAIYGDVGQDETAKRMVRVATESTFFRNFWILMPTWSPGWLVATMRDELELGNVGVISIDPETRKEERIRVPAPPSTPQGRPIPDRQVKAAADLKRLLRNV
jgi:hypothetical protein